MFHLLLVNFSKVTSEKVQNICSQSADFVLYESNSTIRVAIHNKKKPGLVHLLEHGHAKKNGGRTKALPHVEPEERKLEGMITQEVVQRFKR